MLDTAPASPSAARGTSFDVTTLKRTFDDEGYVILRNVLSRQTLATVNERLTDEYARWQASNASFRGGGLLSGHLNCYPGEVARSVLDELKQKGVVDLAQSLFPTDPKATRSGCNFNLPGSVEQHYHMDGLFLENFLIVNVAVVDTDLQNGAIDVIPKTHKRFYKYWEFATQGVYRGTTRLPMSQGDVLIRISTLWHRGMPNRTQRARPMLAFTMGEKGVNNEDPFAYADGRVEFQTNWFTTSFLGRLRERTTVMAPITYSAYRFARSLVGNKGYASF
jgi:hypothetical protein